MKCGLCQRFAVGSVDLLLQDEVFFAELLQLLVQDRALPAFLPQQHTQLLTPLRLLLGEREQQVRAGSRGY